MTAYRVIVAERKDLPSITVICPTCGTRTSFDRLEEENLPPSGDRRRIPKHCASCESPFGDYVMDALRGLAAFYRASRAAEGKAGKPIFQFEIRQPE